MVIIMKNTKLLTNVILICLILFGILSILLESGQDENLEFQTAITSAEDYMNRGLYQLAIEEYEKAIVVKDSEEIRDAIFVAYEKRYVESKKILNDYIVAAESAITAFNKNENYYLILADVYMRNDSYQSAYKTLGDAIDNGITSEKINELYLDIKYAYEMDWYTYEDYKSCVDGLYPVMNSSKWGYIDETGIRDTDLQYDFVSQPGDDGVRIIVGEENTLINSNDVLQGKLKFTPVKSGIYSEGYIAIDNGESYGYYTSLGDFSFGEYISASNFQNFKAMVEVSEDVWTYIDSTGQAISNETYQDIRLTNNGDYLLNNVILAKKDGKFRLYNQEDETIGDFECDDIGVNTTDNLIAFEKNGTWGYVNSSAEIVIEPIYENAKSFSNGLGSVCVDGKWGFIDENGQIVIDCQFLDTDYFNIELNCLVKTSPEIWQMIKLKVDF